MTDAMTAAEIVEEAQTGDPLRFAIAAHARLSNTDTHHTTLQILEPEQPPAPGPLTGVAIALKDNICQRGTRTTCASRLLEHWEAPYDATVAKRLRDAGALLVAKTNMDEFGMGSSTENSAFGPTTHPLDATRVPGGSSGGSAAIVAAALVPIALGSDTGGSVRQPAAFCGVFGLKPTYGAVSRFGLVAFGSSLDQIGPLATTSRDCARTFDVIAGHDPADATSAKHAHASTEQACGRSVVGERIGVPRALLEGASDEVLRAFDEGLSELREAGAEVVDIELPNAALSVSAYYVLATAEASSNLARFDGGRYGLRVDAPDLQSMYERTRACFGAEVKRRILLGTFALSAGYHDRFYAKAQAVRHAIAADFATAFAAGCTAVATPTTPTVAFELGSYEGDPLAMYLSDLYTLPASLAGLPALSAPLRRPRGALPAGLQLVAPAFQEATLFALGSVFG